MNDALVVTTAVYALGLGLWCLAGAVRRRPVGRNRLAAAVVLEAAALAQAIAAGVGMLLGHRPAELATHIAYLAASVAILPAALASGGDRGAPADPAVLGIAGIALAVVAMRARATWPAAA